jgi:hypothetical protein
MANASVGAVRIIDGDGDVVESDGSGRLKVETEQDDAFGTWVTYDDFEAATTATAISDGSNGTGATITDAKEILIQTDDANTGYIMVGSGSGTALAGTVGSRKGIKLNGGETLILALSTFANIFIDASTSSQFVNVAYFK